MYPLAGYLKDRWEYNFACLGSESSKEKAGAGKWSKEANRVFGSRGSPMLMMADEMDQVLELDRRLREQDRLHPNKQYIERVDTIF